MVGVPKQSSSATTSVLYLTVGSLMSVWSAVYYFWLGGRAGGHDMAYLWCAGFFFSGLVLCGIGLAIGRIGRAARDAEVAPTEEVRVNNAATSANGTAAPPVH